MTAHERHRTPAGDAASSLPGVLCDLPMLRPVALRMLKVLSHEEPEYNEVVRILKSDPGFAAEILTAANSALYTHSHVDTLMRALVVLGTDRIKTLTMSVAMRAFLKNFPQTEEMRKCWRHSRASALLAEELAGRYGVQKDRAYTAALMHDLGRFGLLAGSNDDYTALLRAGCHSPEDLLVAERERLGFDHCEAGALLIRTWRLSSEIARAAARHHLEPDENTPLLRAVGAACRLAAAMGYESVQYGCTTDPAEIVAALPGRPASLAELHDTLHERFDTLALS